MPSKSINLTCTDKTQLPATLYTAPDPKAVIVIGSALGVPRKIYRVFAEFLVNHSYSVLTFDYRGFAPNTEARDLHLAQWGSHDLQAAIAHAKEQANDKPVFLLGHSIGGQVAALANNLEEVKGLIFVASSFPYLKRWPMPKRLNIALLFKVLTPLIAALTKSFPSKAIGLSSTNLPSVLVAEWARWMGKDDYLLDPQFGLDKSGYINRRGPALAFGFDDDDLVPEASFDKLLTAYANCDIQRRFIETKSDNWTSGPVGHMGFFKAQHEHTLWQECIEWLEQHRH